MPDHSHVATIHMIVDAAGNVLVDRHPPHPKDFVLATGEKIRRLEKEEEKPHPRKRRQRQATVKALDSEQMAKRLHEDTSLQIGIDIEKALKKVVDAGPYPAELKKGRPSRSG